MFNHKIRLIEDRIRIKLMLLEIDEKKVLSDLIVLQEPHKIIIPNFIIQSKHCAEENIKCQNCKNSKRKENIVITIDKLNETGQDHQNSLLKRSNFSFMTR